MVEDLVNRYRMSVSQMTTYIFRLSKFFFPLPRPNTRFVTRNTRRVPLVAQELFTPPEGLITLPVFSEIFVVQILILVDQCLVFFGAFSCPLYFLSLDFRLLISPLVRAVLTAS